MCVGGVGGWGGGRVVSVPVCVWGGWGWGVGRVVSVRLCAYVCVHVLETRGKREKGRGGREREGERKGRGGRESEIKKICLF